MFIEIEKSVNISSYPTLENCLFGAVKLTKHVDIDLYKYSGYSIGFDRKGSYSIGEEIGRNVISFGVDMSLSLKIDNKGKDILIKCRKVIFNQLYWRKYKFLFEFALQWSK